MRISRGYADGPFGQIHYQEEGSGEPFILFHQMVQSSFQFEPSLPLLASKGLRAIAVDIPGYGMSCVPDHAPTMTEYASIYPSLLEHFGFNKAHVGGHHTGASIACEIAYQYSNLVSKLVLHGVPYYDKEEMAQKSGPIHKAQKIEEDGTHFSKVWKKFHNAGNSKTSFNVTHNSILTYFIAGETEWHGHNAVYGHNIWKAVKGIKSPTLLISNTGDMLNPQDKNLSKERPDFKFIEFEGGSFQFVYDNADVWSEMVSEFIIED